MSTLKNPITLICGKNKDGRRAIWFVLGEYHPNPLSEDLNRVAGLIRRRDRNFDLVEEFFILAYTKTTAGHVRMIIPDNLLVCE